MSTAPPLHYVAIGDSITFGIGSLIKKGFVYHYRQYLKQDLKRKITYENLGKIGWTSSDLLGELEKNDSFVESIRKADIITVSIGGNDLLQAKDNLKNEKKGELKKIYDTFRWNFIRLDLAIKKIKKAQGKPYILRYIEIYNPRPQHPLTQKWIPRFNRVINKSRDSVTRTAKTYRTFQQHGKKLLFFDGEHPNRKGHSHIASNLRETGYDPLVKPGRK